jgi:hypothetical protein
MPARYGLLVAQRRSGPPVRRLGTALAALCGLDADATD